MYLLPQNLQASGAADSDSDSALLKNQLADIQAKLGEKTKEVTDHLAMIKNLVCMVYMYKLHVCIVYAYVRSRDVIYMYKW